MRSFTAALRTLVLPFGATTGRRIVLDGINGRIQFYDANGILRIEIGRLDDTMDFYSTATNEDEAAHVGTSIISGGGVQQAFLQLTSPRMVAPDTLRSVIELMSEADDGSDQPSINIDAERVELSPTTIANGVELVLLGTVTAAAELFIGGGTAFPDVEVVNGILNVETGGRINIGADPVPRANNSTGTAAHTNVQYGTVVVAVAAGGQTFTTAVVFDEAYDAAPVVVTGFNSTSGARAVEVEARSVTTTGFTATVRASAEVNFGGAANYTISWIAVGEVSP